MRRFILVVLLLTMLHPGLVKASEVTSIKITETTPMFNEYAKVGVLEKGTSHTIIRQTDRFYHTIIGNQEVKFSKKRAQVIEEPPANWKGAHPVRAKAVKQVDILEKPSIHAKRIGYIQANSTLHVQRLKGNYYPVIVGGQTGYIHKNDLRVQSGIPVLMYHDIVQTKSDQNISTLEVEKFQQQMDYLKANGWTTVTPKELEEWVVKKRKLPEKSVLITFDDGYASTIELAYPILKNHGFKATSFLITSRIERPGMVTVEDLIRTKDVYSYENHTHTFHMFNSKTGRSLLEYESEKSIYHDIQQANNIIERVLGTDVTTHAYPYGKRSPQAIRALKSAGITSAYTIDEGNVFQGDSLFELKRQRIHSNMTLKDFIAKLEGR